MESVSLYIRIRNFFHPGFGSCYKCGGNWGWKKHTTHPTTGGEGIFLFCQECDRVVTSEERWQALDAWKERSISQLRFLSGLDSKQVVEEIKKIRGTELAEFPRRLK